MADGDGSTGVLQRLDRPVFALDGDWRFTYLNGGAESLLDRRAETVRGRVIWDELPGLMSTSVPQAFHGAVTHGEVRRETAPLDGDRDGEAERRIEFEVHPGGDGGVTVLLEDVTDRERDVRRTRQYELAFQAADDPIFVLDAEGRFVEVNDAMVELTGYDRPELVGSPFSLLLDEEEMARAERQARERITDGDGAVGTVNVTVTTAVGDRRTCEVSVALLSGAAGVDGTVGVMRDVTDRRHREQRLAVLDRVLRHNIRNEMNVVIGRAEIASREAEADVAEHLEAILATAKDLVSLSQDIRRFSDALAPGAGSARPRDAVAAARATVEEMRENHPGADVRLRVREPGWIRAHESAYAAIEEIVENAVVHNDNDRPTVEVIVEAHGTPEDGTVEIHVVDDGPGLPGPERKVLTEGSETPLSHASGIGLWLVNWSVSKSGGELDFAENDPRGSVITLRFQRTTPPEEERTGATTPGSGGSGPGTPGSGAGSASGDPTAPDGGSDTEDRGIDVDHDLW